MYTWNLNSEYSYIISPVQNLQPKSDQVKPPALWRSKSSVFSPPKMAVIHSLRAFRLQGGFCCVPLFQLSRKAGFLSGGTLGECHFYDLLPGLEPLPSTQGPQPPCLGPVIPGHIKLPGCSPGFASEVNWGFPGKASPMLSWGLPFKEARSLRSPPTVLQARSSQGKPHISLGCVSLTWHRAQVQTMNSESVEK